ncbi:MAG: MoxR-like ATPase [Planctomycetota bacterium]|jgi:MoxR-like ATPase
MSDSATPQATPDSNATGPAALDMARAVTATGQAVSEVAMEALGVLRERVRSVVSVSDDVLEPILVALVAGGHCLIEGIPGTGKTLLSRTLARCLDCTFTRIQFTNDLMPSDIVGSSVWRAGEERFEFLPGPLFSNIVLADEVNRTSSRTLSCLLEAMEEGAVSVDGTTMSLGTPFSILATRNPVEFHGTFPIPEAALDRFLVHVELGYPDAEAERGLYRAQASETSLDALEPAVTREQLVLLQATVPTIEVSKPVAEYAYNVVQETRNDESVALGVSPRAGVSWLFAARARALIHGRDYVLPDDLKALAIPVLSHRVFLKGGGSALRVIEGALERVPVAL